MVSLLGLIWFWFIAVSCLGLGWQVCWWVYRFLLVCCYCCLVFLVGLGLGGLLCLVCCLGWLLVGGFCGCGLLFMIVAIAAVFNCVCYLIIGVWLLPWLLCWLLRVGCLVWMFRLLCFVESRGCSLVVGLVCVVVICCFRCLGCLG